MDGPGGDADSAVWPPGSGGLPLGPPDPGGAPCQRPTGTGACTLGEVKPTGARREETPIHLDRGLFMGASDAIVRSDNNVAIVSGAPRSRWRHALSSGRLRACG